MAGISEGLLSLHEGLRDPNLGAGSEHSTKLIGPENHPKVSDFYHVDLKQLAEINMIEKYILGKDNIDSVSPFEVYKPKVDELVIWDLPDHQAPVARVPRKEEEEDLSAAEKENNRRMSTQEGGEVLSEEPAKPGSNPAPLVIPTQEGDRYAAEEGEKDSPEEETKGEATGSTNETQEKPPSEENPGATLEYGSHDEQNADQATSEVAMDNNPNLDDIDYQGFCEGEEESLRTTTYMPFGEGGTTATVTGWGQAMQITQYLGCGPSSLFCLDDKDMPEPYYTSSREEGLVSFSDERYALGVDCTFPDMNFRTRASWLHNKWPRLEFHGKDWRLEQQWAVKEGVVVEQIMFYNDKDTDMDFLHYNNFDFRIRELDFIEPACNFNKPSKRNFQGEEDEDEESEKNDCAIKGPGPGGFGFVQIQKFSSEDDNERYRKSEETSHPDSVAAIAGFLVNGKPLTYAQVTENKTHHVKAKSSHQMVVGYKLILLHSEDHNSNWKRLTLTVQDMDINEILRNENEEANAPQWDANLPPIVHAKASNAQDERIVEKSIKRAVENILSVCMIPVGDGYYWNISTDLRDCDLAMTCGDLSGHRVCPSASFFAFKLLIDVAEAMAPKTADEPMNPFRNRIKSHCRAHIRWIVRRAKGQKSTFSRNYWVTGTTMPSSKQLPPNEPANAPFQILKIYEYFRVFNEPEDVSFRSDLGIQADEPHTWIHTWLEELQNANKRSMYGWPRDQKEGTGSFYLVDHVWIWNAVSAISKMFPQKNDTMKMKKTKPKQQTTFQTSISIVNSEKAKVEILKRFTAFNSPFKERMLAVKRSLRESQFDFQFSDTALFYGFQYSGVPLLDPQDSRWRSAIKAQEKYVSEEQNQLENPSRDCMRLLMAEYITEHYQPFDARPQELQNPNALKTEEKKEFEVDLNQARENLVSLFLCNGLFRGLSSEYEIPVDPPSSRDYFLHTSFEAHYVLWNSFYRIKTEKPPAWTPSQKLSAPDNFSPIVQLNPNLDQNIVVEPSEEWLYNYPEFLDRKPNLPQVFDTYYNWLVERYRQQSHLQYVELAIEEAKGEPEGVETRLLNKFASNASRPHGCGNLMIDIPRKSNHSSKPFFSRPMSESWERLKKRRNITNSKKRLLWFAQPDLQVASLAFLASTDKEQIHMRSFLDRHASHSLFLENKAVRIRNVWETEFHCSFMQLVYRKGSKRTQAKNNRQTIDSHTHSPDCEHGMEFGEWDPASSEWSGKSSKRSIEDILRTRCPMVTPRAIHGWKDVALVRGSASFRFVGDFFDRYWTCHFLESYPAMETTVETTSDSASWESKLSFLSVKKSKCGRKDRYQNKDDDEQILKRVFGEDSKETEKIWQQRRVLEGLMFFKIVSVINQSTSLIHTEIMDTLEQSDLKNISPKSYFDSHETWSSMNEAMETLKEDLGQIEKHIQDWRTREDRLANERPRWTRNDEYRYRDAINRVQLLHDIVERNFKATEADVRKVAQILKLRQETQKAKYDQTMTDLSWRQNANVALFTYATVFFLPLGFATSFLSMQAPPSSYLIRQMVFCFLGALGVLIGVVAVVLILISQHTDSDLSISRGAPKTYRNVSGAVKKWISRHKNSSNDTEAQTV